MQLKICSQIAEALASRSRRSNEGLFKHGSHACSPDRLVQEQLVFIHDLLLEIAVEHLDLDSIRAEVIHASPGDGGIRILDADPDLRDSSEDDPFSAGEFRCS